MDDKDYNVLVGKEIEVINFNPTPGKGVVVGCDPDIGITIVEKAYPDKFLMCLVLPSSPLWKKCDDCQKEPSKVVFREIVHVIERGLYNYDIFNSLVKDIYLQHGFRKEGVYIKEASKNTCPFGQ